jgi:Fe-S oxidoreductase
MAHLLASRSMLLAEFLDRIMRFQPAPARGSILLHGHCNQHAIFGMQHDVGLLERAGYDCRLLDEGCCGMAGAFGYERHKYEVSRAIFDQGLGARLAATPAASLLVSDGFSCREQVRQLTGRRAVTLPELLVAPAQRPAPARAAAEAEA